MQAVTWEDKNSGFLKRVHNTVTDEKDRSVIIGLRDVVLASLERVRELKGMKSMDV